MRTNENVHRDLEQGRVVLFTNWRHHSGQHYTVGLQQSRVHSVVFCTWVESRARRQRQLQHWLELTCIGIDLYWLAFIMELHERSATLHWLWLWQIRQLLLIPGTGTVLITGWCWLMLQFPHLSKLQGDHLVYGLVCAGPGWSDILPTITQEYRTKSYYRVSCVTWYILC